MSDQVDALDEKITEILLQFSLGPAYKHWDMSNKTVLSSDGRYVEARAKLSALLVAAERRGEVYQIKMLQHWQNLHDISIEPDDLQHIADSLEQIPDQPLARLTLQELEKLQGGR